MFSNRVWKNFGDEGRLPTVHDQNSGNIGPNPPLERIVFHDTLKQECGGEAASSNGVIGVRTIFVLKEIPGHRMSTGSANQFAKPLLGQTRRSGGTGVVVNPLR